MNKITQKIKNCNWNIIIIDNCVEDVNESQLIADLLNKNLIKHFYFKYGNYSITIVELENMFYLITSFKNKNTNSIYISNNLDSILNAAERMKASILRVDERKREVEPNYIKDDKLDA